jgi:nicotinamidase-related amidase
MAHNGDKLLFGRLGGRCAHVCVDMQRLFAEETAWKTPWLSRVLPKILEIVQAHPEETIFTRFVPVARPGEGHGTWKRYYERWAEMTLERIGREMIGLVPDLARFAPPAVVIDKRVYSPWHQPALAARLAERSIDTLVISGGETDVCVLATVLGAVDRGFRVVLATDALCSSSDQTHDALLTVYENRYGQQVEAVSTEVILGDWR